MSGRGPRVRHGIFAVTLLAVAGLRLAGGDLVWVAVLGAAGLAEAWLMTRERSSVPATETPQAPTSQSAVDRGVVERSLRSHRRGLRLWTVALALCICAALALVVTASVMAAVVAVLALVSLHQVRRERRSVASLLRLAGANRLHPQGAA